MTRSKRIVTTVVADAHNLFRRGLATLISAEPDMEVTGEATTALQAIALASPAESTPDQPAAAPADVLLMEISLANDPEIIKSLRQLGDTTAILFLAPQESPDCLELTVASGARGYMLKTTPAAHLIAGIRQATSGENALGLSPQAPDLRALAESERSYSRTSPLTAREQEVMTLLAEGRTVREVAAELSLSIKTIEAHKLNLMRKLDIHNRATLVDYAIRAGFIASQTAHK